MDETRKSYFARQIRLPSFGEKGQEKLLSSSALVIGLGGLGTPAVMYLANSGVGKIGVMDFDTVEMSNLHRQPIYSLADLGKRKAQVTSDFLKNRTPEIEIKSFEFPFTEEIGSDFLKEWDVVLDCTDSLSSKMAANDLCVKAGKPFVFASVFRISAQIALFSGKGKPCYRCLYPNLENSASLMSCEDGGVLGIITGLAGMQQASFAIRSLLSQSENIEGKLFQLDWDSPVLYETKIQPNVKCTICSDKSKNLFEMKQLNPEEITFFEYSTLSKSEPTFLVDVREEDEQFAEPISGSCSLPLSQIEAGTRPSFPKDSTIVAICATGVRSKRAVSLLKSSYGSVYSFKGGKRFFDSYSNSREKKD
ncbi:hypothetical protein CH373_09735 [Leptospira perolatii]|uniref:Rhodanese domain-containing protein n=1 Tax=Leptospira perolatii TaxID=2023191 RepID=A0A2M9ZML0_9LEPT|nr:HesA/MoeB/ThiF family protein [Leptospira perolatii]PJZ70067.1 hypothetical protein CH360_07480 [Leptospira perolatii]PJZ73255.1 hypothetical protein CH373_09735 [Leptospira perolatii]